MSALRLDWETDGRAWCAPELGVVQMIIIERVSSFDTPVHHTATRLFTVHVTKQDISADSMGAIASTAKKLWGQCPQVAPTGILLCHFLKH